MHFVEAKSIFLHFKAPSWRLKIDQKSVSKSIQNRSKNVSFWSLILGPKTTILYERSSLFQEPVLAWTGSALKTITLWRIRKHVQAFGGFAWRGLMKSNLVQSQASMGKHVRALMKIGTRVQAESSWYKHMRACMGKRLGHLVNNFRGINRYHASLASLRSARSAFLRV